MLVQSTEISQIDGKHVFSVQTSRTMRFAAANSQLEARQLIERHFPEEKIINVRFTVDVVIS